MIALGCAMVAPSIALAGCDDELRSCETPPGVTAGLRPIAHAYVSEDRPNWGHSRELVVEGDLLRASHGPWMTAWRRPDKL